MTIGSDVVIGAGSVMSRDSLDGVLIYDNPCRVIRKFYQWNREYYFKYKKYPVEYLVVNP
ncbi:hypothetical protein NG891_10390 [Enterococcus gallinarum]|nr:hypothetical protein [Enterococcus gallinarum]